MLSALQLGPLVYVDRAVLLTQHSVGDGGGLWAADSVLLEHQWRWKMAAVVVQGGSVGGMKMVCASELLGWVGDPETEAPGE